MTVQQGIAQSAAAAAPSPPPGLEGLGTPAKLEVGETLRLLASGGASIDVAGSCCKPELATQAEWVSAVMAAVPYLDAQSSQQAFGILDFAIHNMKEAEALEVAIADADEATAGSTDSAWATSMRPIKTAELMLNRIYEKQHMLLYQLHCLHASAQVYAFAADSLVAAADSTIDIGDRHHDSGKQGETLDQRVATEADGSGDAVADRILSALGHPQKAIKGNGKGSKAAQLAGTAAGAAAAAATRPLNKPADHSLRGSAQVQTLSSSLQLLAGEDPDCLFIVRRINKLGFKACRKLKQHFSAYGSVVRVLVAHSTVRSHGDQQCSSRRRPSSLGFVHMASADAVRKVLTQGGEHEVEGSLIRVQRFERQASDGLTEEVHEAAELQHGSAVYEALSKGEWCRQQSAFSTASTRTAASTAVSLESELEGGDAESAEQESN